MTPKDAKKILELSGSEEKTEIRKNYRRLMKKYHPDVLKENGPEHLQRVHKLIEAYHLLMNKEKEKAESGRQKYKWKWTGKVNEKAFCERNIYLFYSLEVEGTPYYQVAKGKYMWDPEEEEFSLFLLSLRQASKELLEQVEDGNGIYIQEFHIKEKRFQTQAVLIPLLAQQFMEPLSVLVKMSTPESSDEDGREIYHFRARIITEVKKSLSKGEVLYPKGFQGNRIIVMNRERKILGSLSFDEDYLYFCIIPLLKQKRAQIKMRVRDIRKEGKAEVDFYFRPEQQEEYDQSDELNKEIQAVIARYGTELRG